MTERVQISAVADLSLFGTRYIAKKIRSLVEDALSRAPTVEIDFSGIDVTQSFVDELLGPLILRQGDSALERLGFRGCSDNVRAIISFVIAGRLQDYGRLHQAGEAPEKSTGAPL